MPRLTKKQLAEVKYVSMADYYNKVGQYEDFNDKLKFTTKYLLTHSAAQNPDYPIEQAIHLAKVRLIDDAVKKHDDYMKKNKWKDTEAHIVDPYSKNDKAAEMFMANPVDYLVGEANKTMKELNSSGVRSPKTIEQENILKNTLDSMPINVRDKIKQLDQGGRVLDMQARMEARYGGREGLNKAYQATKGSFMSRLFGTSSAAAKNLDQVFNAFNNPNHVLYGDIKALDKAAVQYVQHNFPDWQLFQKLPTEADFDGLSETEKARMRFSINLLKSECDQTEMEDRITSLVKACENQNIEYSDIKVDDHKVINLDDSEDEIEEESLIEEKGPSKDNQKEFRNKLLNNIKEDDNYKINKEENNNNIEKEIEEEQIDDLDNTI